MGEGRKKRWNRESKTGWYKMAWKTKVYGKQKWEESIHKYSMLKMDLGLSLIKFVNNFYISPYAIIFWNIYLLNNKQKWDESIHKYSMLKMDLGPFKNRICS